MKLSVVLPTYNEKENILELINQINKYANPYEIIVVDDNSPDMTWKVAEEANIPNVRVIRRVNERGLPSAISHGISQARGNIVSWMDCDLSHPPSLLPQMISKLDNFDAVIVSRYVSGGGDKRKFLRRITSHIFNAYASFVLNANVKDIDSGYIVIKMEVFNKVSIADTAYGEYFIKLMYDLSRNNFKVAEIPFINHEREKGESKTGEGIISLIRHGYRYGKTVLKWRFEK